VDELFESKYECPYFCGMVGFFNLLTNGLLLKKSAELVYCDEGYEFDGF
jgi:hypothetical protein